MHSLEVSSQLAAKINIYNALILQSLRLSENRLHVSQIVVRRCFLMNIEPESGELDELKV